MPIDPLQTAVPVSLLKLEELTPYTGNARTHSEEQVAEIERSITAFGYTSPVLHDAGKLVAGHGRLLAVRGIYARGERIRLPGGEVLPVGTIPAIDCAGWNEAQRRAYTIADNKLAANAGWDDGLLKLEFEFLGASNFDLELTGFSPEEVTDLFGDPWDGTGEGLARYSQAINSPAYIPKGDKPAVETLIDRSKTEELLQQIALAEGLTHEEREFLLNAASRHTVFNYHRIAEFYCHASPQLQGLMEASALVIIDFDKAIAGGFVHMSERLDEIYSATHPEGEPHVEAS
jgi:hypothetical protein